MRSDPFRFGQHSLGTGQCRAATDTERARCERSHAVRYRTGVALYDVDVVQWQLQSLGDYLSKRGFVTLTLGSFHFQRSRNPAASITIPE